MEQLTPKTTVASALALFELPLNDLLYRAHTVHRQNFDANRIQASTLLNIKTGGCSEDCGYCSQSAHHDTGLANAPLMDVEDVRTAARNASLTSRVNSGPIDPSCVVSIDS